MDLVGKRALRNRIMIALAAIAFIAIFFFNVPFPIIIISAGVIGYFGARSGRPEFAAVPHGSGKNTAAVDSMLGDDLPDEHPEHEMLITITFAARGNKTDMVFRQGVFTSVEDRNGHEGGWNQSFDRFAAYLKTVGGRANAR